MLKNANNPFNMISIAAVELRKENQVKNTKHGSNISKKIACILE